MVCGWHIPVSATVVLQIYVILTEALRGVHPVQYALLSDKNRSIYDRLFDMVKETVPEANSRSISCDFQMAAFSERTAFPGVRLHGCFFHLAPNMRLRSASQDDSCFDICSNRRYRDCHNQLSRTSFRLTSTTTRLVGRQNR
ncbi:Transposon Tn7 transposition protein TnsC [Trichinella pseudospiralis]